MTDQEIARHFFGTMMAKGLATSQADACRQLGVTPMSGSNWKVGKTPIGIKNRLAMSALLAGLEPYNP